LGKRNLLLVVPNQFGYSAGYYYYCYYLQEEFNITFFCFDYGLPKIDLYGVDVIYFPYNLGKTKRLLSFISSAIVETYENKYDIIFTKSFKMSEFIGLLGKGSKKILDIRSGSLNNNKLKRRIDNYLIKFRSLYFDNITILSESLRNLLRIPEKKSYILPLGSVVFYRGRKNFSEMKLLYVGTFDKREIYKTIEGFALFFKNYKNMIKCSYTIIGYGKEHEIQMIQDNIKKYNLENIINFVGRKNYTELKPYFKNNNIGVSWVPKTKYFEVQPPTKTFEYILSGMPCIATNTFENKRLINKKNGVLCNDTPSDFFKALKDIYKNLKSYNSSIIRQTLAKHKWYNIVNNYLKKYLKN